MHGNSKSLVPWDQAEPQLLRSTAAPPRPRRTARARRRSPAGNERNVSLSNHIMSDYCARAARRWYMVRIHGRGCAMLVPPEAALDRNARFCRSGPCAASRCRRPSPACGGSTASSQPLIRVSCSSSQARLPPPQPGSDSADSAEIVGRPGPAHRPVTERRPVHPPPPALPPQLPLPRTAPLLCPLSAPMTAAGRL